MPKSEEGIGKAYNPENVRASMSTEDLIGDILTYGTLPHITYANKKAAALAASKEKADADADRMLAFIHDSLHKTKTELLAEYPKEMFFHGERASKFKKSFAPPPEDLKERCGVWIWGAVRTGKTDLAKSMGFYYMKDADNKWFCNFDEDYEGPYNVIVNDVDPTHKGMIGKWKNWCDKGYFPCERKGACMNIRPTLIIFTSNYKIEEMWKDPRDIEAMYDRCIVIPTVFKEELRTPQKRDPIEVNGQLYYPRQYACNMSQEEKVQAWTVPKHVANNADKMKWHTFSPQCNMVGQFEREKDDDPAELNRAKQLLENVALRHVPHIPTPPRTPSSSDIDMQ